MKQPTLSRACFLVGPEERRQLSLLIQTGGKRMAARARIVLLSEQGLTVEQIASELSIVPPTVYKWRKRFAERGSAGLYDLPRPGQPLKLTEQRKQAIVRLVTEAVPADALEWSIRRLARVALWLEDPNLEPDTAASEVQALRACLVQHSTHAARSGTEFFWRNPRLVPRPLRQGY